MKTKTYHGYWKVSFEFFDDVPSKDLELLNDAAKKHIAEMVEQGYIEGELVEEV